MTCRTRRVGYSRNMLMRFGFLLTVTGFTMIVMSWVVPIAGIVMIFGTICAAIALDDEMPTARSAVPIEAQLEAPLEVHDAA